MEDKILSIFLGEQCRKYRKMRGLTQEELAEKLNTTAQTISNYERSGIRDVDVEEQIARALNVNLREETADKEGTVGEVGKELLFSMICNGGSLSVDWMLESVLHGMSVERVNHEIEKLAELDMCCRDRYVDFYGNEKDEVFITAKGIITYKNMISDNYHEEKLQEFLPQVKSYEERLSCPYESDIPMARDLEEFVQLRPWRTLICSIPFSGNYQADYIAFLYKHVAYASPRKTEENTINSKLHLIDRVCPGENIYHDVLYRMAYGLTNQWRDDYFFMNRYTDEESRMYEDAVDIEKMYGNGIDPVIDRSVSLFRKELPWVRDEEIRRKEESPYDYCEKNGLKREDVEEYFEYVDKADSCGEPMMYKADYEGFYKENAPAGKENLYPDKWFTTDEIEAFIRKNFIKPQSDHDRMIQENLREIEKLLPGIRDQYFTFPKEWEKNGLADLVRRLTSLE